MTAGSAAATAPAGRDARAGALWAEPRVVLGLIGLYLAVHLAVRLLTGTTLGIDDAEQALFAQSWSPGYRFRQPPLFTWLLLPAFDLLGPGILAISLVRYALLAITSVAIFEVARRWIGEPRLAALAVFSFALVYVFAYYAHHDLTHTTALGALIALTFLAFARLVERPSLARYLLLGACLGLGVLAKWNYLMLAAGLGLACLIHPAFRPLVLNPRSLAALALAALIVAPSGLWLLLHGPGPAAVTADILAEGEASGPLATLGTGTAALLVSALVFPQPFLVLFVLVFGGAFWRGLRAGGADPCTAPEPRVTAGFLTLLIGVTLALHWLLVPLAGAVTFTPSAGCTPP